MVKNKVSLVNNLVRPMFNQPPRNGQILVPKQKYATYRVDDANAMKTTYEQSQVNPLLPKSNGSTFQHPAYVRTVCDIVGCKDRLCPHPCGKVLENADVGHGTYSDSFPKVKYVSTTDSCGKQRAEFMVSYNPPVENTTGGANINEEKTANLNNNKEALNNVHMNSSRDPIEKANTGSNDPTNIN